MPRWGAVVLLLVVETGCATSRVVHLDTGGGRPVVYAPRADAAPVQLDGDEFEEAVQTLARTAPRSSQPRDAALRLFGVRPSRVRGHLGLVSVEEPQRGRLLAPEASEAGSELESAYGRWCSRKKLSGDCLHLLEEGVTLDEEGKLTLAFRLGLEVVWDETADALEDMTDREALVTMLVTTGVVYFGLWLVPEPLLSKGIAATLTVALIAYLGWDTVWSLVQGWRVLAAEVKTANTFDEVRDAGERYGKVMGKNAARAFVMLAMAALGSTANTLATKIPTLPGSAQAALVGAQQGGFRLAASGQVGAVAVSSGGVVTIALAPEAVAATALGPTSSGVDTEGHEHHIATNKWWESTNLGGPWSPRFQEIFDRAGMSLDDPANKVRIPGHKGPHPQEYHEEVYKRLDDATTGCRSIQRCAEALTQELKDLAREISMPSSKLNKLVTKS
ncbi:AHH domain-containing protein [Pyxidicoccus sp. MSG2]|nr:AHH domain-containing protein [Pyxidicoccus sp. MSG2]MCY1018721.1 AHH domain-containing protein [Pyxidicoccus sp. MSG2]